ncbi:MAG: 3-phosphoshikimate 1-carboxyvinyltransferase [Cryobacterium sp.]|nr:3-phosphoshikimate 1-carboxyvinyltransferase [Cryobacterium sp.]MBX3103381.1 3-phosphoshikimate 1-carboxyvinyltransferase [Cryobacterium sp.]
MLVSKYSKPEFDPYQNDDLVEGKASGPWPAPRPFGPLNSIVDLPASKSLTNRELVLSAIADGPSLLKSPLHSRDTNLMVQALRSLGVQIAEVEGQGNFGNDWLITPAELSGGVTIDCGLAGTVMRFMPFVAALALGPVAFDGDPAARKRPMRTAIQSLRSLGVDVNDDGRASLPFSLYGTGSVQGGSIEIDASESSQFVSGLLLAAPRFEQGLTIRHVGSKLPSLPHIEMTIDVLANRSVPVNTPEPGVWVVENSPIAAKEVILEPDLSNAAPFLAAALIAGGTVSVQAWPSTTTQVGAELPEILSTFGLKCELRDGTLLANGGSGLLGGSDIPGADLDLSQAGELAPTVVAIAALASTPSRITGIGHLRGHETDRLLALATELNGIGGNVTELSDGLQIEPAELHGGLWHSYGDHRMATAGAIIGLAIDGIEIEDIETTAKTLPEFPSLWRQLIHPEPVSVDPLSIGLI